MVGSAIALGNALPMIVFKLWGTKVVVTHGDDFIGLIKQGVAAYVAGMAPEVAQSPRVRHYTNCVDSVSARIQALSVIAQPSSEEQAALAKSEAEIEVLFGKLEQLAA